MPNFTLRYIFSLTIIALLVTGGYLLNGQVQKTQLGDSRVINIAGRQRMLSQKISKVSLEIQNTIDEAERNIYKKELEEAVALWERSHKGLQEWDEELGLPRKSSKAVKKLFVAVDPAFQRILEAAKSIVRELELGQNDTNVTAFVATVFSNEAIFLPGMDKIVFQYDEEAKTRVEKVRRIDFLLLWTVFLVLIAEGFFIFRPAVKKLEEVTEKKQAILAAIGDGFYAVDADSNILTMNQTAGKLIGCSPSECIGKKCYEVFDVKNEKGENISIKDRPVQIVLATGKKVSTTSTTTTTTTTTYYYVRKDGTQFPVAITATPVILNNKIIGAIDIFRDITKDKEIDHAKSEFVSLASHQLRTPLTTISWYAEMVLKGDVGEIIPKQKKYLEEIYRGNKRMIELVNTLLDVSRLELGTFKMEPKPTDVVALAESVVDEQQPKIERKKLIITKSFDKNVPTFSTDPKFLHMVFQNLLANAVEYTPEGGKIEFGISLDKEKQILITVSDTGYGIPKNQQDKIFTKLFRADNVREKDTDGTGLGLYIVKSIIEQSGGKIWFESSARTAEGVQSGGEENKGSTFFVTLPLCGMKGEKGAIK